MSETKTPDWFIEQVRSAHMWAVEKAHEGENHPDNFIDALWIRFSRVENVAKIPEVKALIEALKHYEKTQDISQYIAVHSNFKDNCVAKEALKPFQPKESNE